MEDERCRRMPHLPSFTEIEKNTERKKKQGLLIVLPKDDAK